MFANLPKQIIILPGQISILPGQINTGSRFFSPCPKLETIKRSFELFNFIYINYYLGGHFDFFHDFRNSNKCNFN